MSATKNQREFVMWYEFNSDGEFRHVKLLIKEKYSHKIITETCHFCCFNVRCNDISGIHVTAHRCAGGLKKNLELRRAIDISQGSLTFPSKHRPRVTL